MCSFRGSYGNRGNGMKLRPPDVVPVAGVEPARYRYHGILSPARLPIPSRRRYLIMVPLYRQKNKGTKMPETLKMY